MAHFTLTESKPQSSCPKNCHSDQVGEETHCAKFGADASTGRYAHFSALILFYTLCPRNKENKMFL